MPKTLILFLCLVTSAAFAAKGDFLDVALVQYPIEGKRTYEQVETKVKNYLAQAAKKKAGLIVLPELFLFDLWPIGSKIPHGDIVRTFAPHADPYAALIKRSAENYGVIIVGGSVPRFSGGNLMNSAVVAFPDGRLFYQDKMHLTPWEVQMGFTPGTELKVFSAEWGKFVILICYDLEIPQLSAMLAPVAPELIVSPSMTDNENGLARVRAAATMRAVEQISYVALVGDVGDPSPTFTNRARALIARPATHGITGGNTDGESGKAGLTWDRLNFAQLHEARKKPDVAPARDGSTAKITIRSIP